LQIGLPAAGAAFDLTASQFLVGRVAAIQNGPDGHWVKLRQPRVDLRSQLMKTLVSRFVKDESGATAVEYGLIAAGIFVAIIAVVNGIFLSSARR
jgi:pilus assembly protein Flp/PilA